MKKEISSMILKTLSPIHILNGNRLSPYYDFLFEGGKVFYIDTEKLYDKIGCNNSMIDEYVSIVHKKSADAQSKYTLRDFFEKWDLDINEYSTSSFSVVGDIQANEALEIVKTGGNPYIPGSSIKGAIRTALIYCNMKKDGYNFTSLCNMSHFSDNKKTYIRQDVLRKSINGKSTNDVKSDIMKFLQVSDTSSMKIDRMKIYREELLNLAKTIKQKKMVGNRVPVLVEAIPEGTELKLSIKYTAKYFDDIKRDFDFLKGGKDSELFNRVNTFYMDVINFHIERLEKAGKHMFPNIISKYMLLLDLVKNFMEEKNGFIIRLGSHKTIFNNTIDLAFTSEEKARIENRLTGTKAKKHEQDIFPKTEWFIFEGDEIKEVPGWVMIKLY